MKVSDENGQKTRKIRLGTGVIIIIAMVLIAVIFMNAVLVFQMTAEKTRNVGIYQLSVISSDLELDNSHILVLSFGHLNSIRIIDQRFCDRFY